jgi:hypothetical protein
MFAYAMAHSHKSWLKLEWGDFYAVLGILETPVSLEPLAFWAA